MWEIIVTIGQLINRNLVTNMGIDSPTDVHWQNPAMCCNCGKVEAEADGFCSGCRTSELYVAVEFDVWLQQNNEQSKPKD